MIGVKGQSSFSRSSTGKMAVSLRWHHARRHVMNLEQTRLSRPVHWRGSVALGGRARGKLCRPCAALFDSLFGGGSIDPPGIDPDFSQWLEDEGLPAQKKLALQEYQDAGRGLIALTMIRKGETLLEIPRDLLITPDVALKESSIGADMEAARVPAWTVFAAFLVEQRHMCKTNEEASKWDPYIRRLPSTTGCVLEWPEDDIMRLLNGTSAFKAATAIMDAAKASWMELEPIVNAAEQRDSLPNGVITKESMFWAFGILLSRLIRLPEMGNMEVLVPWADFLNHSPSTSSHLDWDGSLQGVVLRPDTNYKPGEQVFASYGQRSSSELLLSYGFMPEPGSNPFDYVPLTVEIDGDTDPLAKEKTEVLARYGLGPSEDFPMRLDGVPAALIPYQAFALVTGADHKARDLEVLAAELFTGTPEKCQGKAAQLITDSYEKLIRTLRVMVEDLDSGMSNATSKKFSQYERLASEVRKSERRILTRSEFVMREQQRSMTRLRN